MKILYNTSSRVRAAAIIISVLAILTVWADPQYLLCSDVIDNSTNDCDDSCPTCSGFVYDRLCNGSLSCTHTDRYCGTEHLGVLGTDCAQVTYSVCKYSYDNASPTCPPCVRQYFYVGTTTIHDVLLRYTCEPL